MLNFLRDLCTPEELHELSERWDIAQMLAKGESYRSIAAKTKVSTTTITRIAGWLNNGEGGYAKAIKNAKKKRRIFCLHYFFKLPWSNLFLFVPQVLRWY